MKYQIYVLLQYKVTEKKLTTKIIQHIQSTDSTIKLYLFSNKGVLEIHMQTLWTLLLSSDLHHNQVFLCFKFAQFQSKHYFGVKHLCSLLKLMTTYKFKFNSKAQKA